MTKSITYLGFILFEFLVIVFYIYILGQYYEGFELEGRQTMMPSGIYNLEDLKEYGRMRNWCPYFLARFAVNILLTF